MTTDTITTPTSDPANSTIFPGTPWVSPAMPSEIFGTPVQDATLWEGQQTEPMGCAIRVQQNIIEEFTGQKLSETALSSEATAHGWFSQTSGTPLQDMGLEMQLHGIANHETQNANVFDLENELSQGHKIIVGVDAGALWNGTADGRGHAIEVTGIDLSDPNNPQVIVNDPGVPNGAGNHYSLSQFTQAWSGSNDLMVATDAAPPSQATSNPLTTTLPTLDTPHIQLPDHQFNPDLLPSYQTPDYSPMHWAQHEFDTAQQWFHDATNWMGQELAHF